jgi:hypothetical protein
MKWKTTFAVIVGLDPAIHSVAAGYAFDRYRMDARVKPWHDDRWGCGCIAGEAGG